ncbi:MAG: hypothetical protein JNM64_16925, partial [Chloroflexia bacterium]|nr:hypothetical protein [Chloroflexia bacterium]
KGGHYADLYNTYFRHQSPDYRPPDIAEPVPSDPPMEDLLPSFGRPADYMV